MATTKKQAAKTAADSTTIAKAQGINLDTALAGLTKAQTSISRTLADIQEELIAKYAELEAITGAIELKKQEMSNLHGADAVLLSIDELRAKSAEELAAAETQRKTLAAQYDQLRKDAETARQREEAEYKYRTEQTRKLDADQWAAMKGARERDEAIRLADLELSIQRRTAAIAQSEQDHATLLEQAKTFDARLDAAVKKEVATQVGAIKREMEHAAKVNDITALAERQNLARVAEEAKAQATRAEAEIARLREELSSAYASQRDLATKTVEAAANRGAVAEAMATFTAVGGANGNGARRPA